MGDTASARVNAEKALAGGYDRRWFGFPWFAGSGRSLHAGFRNTCDRRTFTSFATFLLAEPW